MGSNRDRNTFTDRDHDTLTDCDTFTNRFSNSNGDSISDLNRRSND